MSRTYTVAERARLRRTSAGPLIRSAREKRGLSQGELATRLGVRTNYVSMLETGAKDLGPDRVLKIAQILGVTEAAERDRWLAAAGHLPDKLRQALLKHPERWDQ